MNRKRVLVFTETALALSETFIAAHCRSLQQYEYRLVALYRSGEHHGDVRRHLLFPSGKPNALTRLAFRLGYNRQLDNLIQAFQPDIIHAHYLTNGAFLAPYARQHGVPLVITVHGHDALRVLRNGSVYDQLFRLQRQRLARDAATLLPVSNFLRKRLLAGGFLPERTRTHYLGIELPSTPLASPASNPPNIVFVGRLVAKKGLDVVLRAFAMVRSARPDAELHIVGDGPLRRLLSQSGRHSDGVIWHGAQTPDRVQQIMAGARLLTLPSRQVDDGDAEGFGLVLTEAQALGIPVVTSDQGGTLEALLPGVTGLAVDPTSATALADAFLQLLNDSQRAAIMGSNARLWVQENFDIRQQARALERIYDELAEGSRIASVGA